MAEFPYARSGRAKSGAGHHALLLASLALPFLESYWLVCSMLAEGSVSIETDPNQLALEVQRAASLRASKGLRRRRMRKRANKSGSFFCYEAISVETLRNASRWVLSRDESSSALAARIEGAMSYVLGM